MHSSDAAESIIRMSLNGIEVAAKISGSGAKNVAVLLYAILKNKKMTKGKTNLVNMLKTGKELKIFTVKKEDLKRFTNEADRYGVLFTALVDKKSKSNDGIIDVMVKAEDAAKINRIVERFKLTTYDQATITSKIDKRSKANPNKGVEVMSMEDKLADDILGKPIQKEENAPQNPNLAKMEKSPPSEHLSNNKKNLEGTNSNNKKPSVREELKNIKAEQKKELVKEQDKKIETPAKNNIHVQPKKSKKIKERG